MIYDIIVYIVIDNGSFDNPANVRYRERDVISGRSIHIISFVCNGAVVEREN